MTNQDALTAIAAAEALAAGDTEGILATMPRTPEEMGAQRAALVLLLADAIVDGDISFTTGAARAAYLMPEGKP